MSKKEYHRGLHLISLIPDEPLLSEIHRFKELASERFDSSHAFNAPAHITMFPPFHIGDHYPAVRDRLASVSKDLAPFEIRLSGFDHFGKRVIFVDVEDTPRLRHCQDLVKGRLTDGDLLPYRGHDDFHPHVTVAFKDLKPSVFPAAWEYFRSLEYEASFMAHSLYLMIHRQKQWEVRERYGLEG